MYKFGLIGYPLSHSMSKVIQEAAFESIGAEGSYEIMETEQEDLISRLKYIRANKFNGFNVTIPLKVPITLFLSGVDNVANVVGSANTIKVMDDSSLFGYNTDVYGFVEAIPEEIRKEIENSEVAILGSGGAARAVGVGIAIGGGIGLLACGGMGFAAGFSGNVLSQSISSYRETGSIKIDFGDAVFSGVTNTLVCMATMVGMNSCMSDSFSPALSGKTFGSRFVEFMSFDCANTMYSAYFGITYGLFDGAISLIKYLVELEISKPTTSSLLVNQ